MIKYFCDICESEMNKIDVKINHKYIMLKEGCLSLYISWEIKKHIKNTIIPSNVCQTCLTKELKKIINSL